jgi:NAD dependent epimerase/dehydratase family enzyme
MPAFLLRLMLGEMAETLILASRRIEPRKLLSAGYPFRFPELESALRHELERAA